MNTAAAATTTTTATPEKPGGANDSTAATSSTAPETESEQKQQQSDKPTTTEASTSRNAEPQTAARSKSFEPVQARAIHDFQSKESGDLNFKKGDLIFLKKKIDKNWCVGELNGKTGTFPINHVQVSNTLRICLSLQLSINCCILSTC